MTRLVYKHYLTPYYTPKRADKSLSYAFIYGVMRLFHTDIIRKCRWDLSTESRQYTIIHLN